MRKDYVQRIITKHGNKIKVFGGIFSIFVMLMAIKAYVNYSAIVNETENVNNNANNISEKTAYAQNFDSKYQDSEYAMYFLSHKNNILFDGEYIIKISTTPKEIETNDNNPKGENHQETPQESRQRFIKSKIN